MYHATKSIFSLCWRENGALCPTCYLHLADNLLPLKTTFYLNNYFHAQCMVNKLLLNCTAKRIIHNFFWRGTRLDVARLLAIDAISSSRSIANSQLLLPKNAPNNGLTVIRSSVTTTTYKCALCSVNNYLFPLQYVGTWPSPPCLTTTPIMDI